MKWFMTLVPALLLVGGEVRAQGKVKAAKELAEFLIAKFGSKAGANVPALAGRIEGIAVKYGDDALAAVRKGGPSACHLIESAGANGAKAVKVLATHGELGAARVSFDSSGGKTSRRFSRSRCRTLARRSSCGLAPVSQVTTSRALSSSFRTNASIRSYSAGGMTTSHRRRVAARLDGVR
jgi:hypothetical protein